MRETKIIAILTTIPLVLLLGTIANTTTQNAFACGLDNLGSCFGGLDNNGYQAGISDTAYDHDNSLVYNPQPQCCHSDDYIHNFHDGYDHQWNQYLLQSSSQTANVNVENSPGATVNVGQSNNQEQQQQQNQGPSVQPQPEGCQDSCNSNPCDNNCVSPPCGACGSDGGQGYLQEFHHFGWFHHHFGYGLGYRHVDLGDENP
ncbi:MAG: hypothetical protein WA364_21945 [Candidatus Nitrosopolaris sp.]